MATRDDEIGRELELARRMGVKIRPAPDLRAADLDAADSFARVAQAARILAAENEQLKAEVARLRTEPRGGLIDLPRVPPVHTSAAALLQIVRGGFEIVARDPETGLARRVRVGDYEFDVHRDRMTGLMKRIMQSQSTTRH